MSDRIEIRGQYPEGFPECGVDFCQVCGDCLSCHGGERSCDYEGVHTFPTVAVAWETKRDD